MAERTEEIWGRGGHAGRFSRLLQGRAICGYSPPDTGRIPPPPKNPMNPRAIAALCAFLTASLSGAAEAAAGPGSVERNDPAIDALVSPDARVEVIGSGFGWSEGPVWRKQGGYLLFSDIPNNTIYRWKEGEGRSEERRVGK